MLLAGLDVDAFDGELDGGLLGSGDALVVGSGSLGIDALYGELVDGILLLLGKLVAVEDLLGADLLERFVVVEELFGIDLLERLVDGALDPWSYLIIAIQKIFKYKCGKHRPNPNFFLTFSKFANKFI